MSSLPFLVVLDMCTTLARLDLGIVERLSMLGGMSRESCSFNITNFLILYLIGLSGRQEDGNLL